MKNVKEKTLLQKEIIRLREQMDTLLSQEGTDSDIVLELSRKLDKIITEYYRSKENTI